MNLSTQRRLFENFTLIAEHRAQLQARLLETRSLCAQVREARTRVRQADRQEICQKLRAVVRATPFNRARVLRALTELENP